MTVAFDARNLGPTGVGTYARLLLQHLTRREDVRVRPFCWRGGAAQVRELGARPRVRSARLPLLPPPADVLHAPDFLLPPRRHSHRLATVHDLSFAHFPDDYTPEHVRRFDDGLRQQFDEGAAAVCDSDSTRGDVLDRYRPDPALVHVVHLGLGDEWQQRAEPWRDGGPYLLHVGAWVARKRLPLVVQTFEMVAEEYSDLRLVLAGPQVAEWARDAVVVHDFLAARPDLAKRVDVLGLVTDAQVRSLYAGAAAHITCTRWEGFGLTVLQALASGTPTVTPRHSSLPEVGGDVAFYADGHEPADFAAALLRALDADDSWRDRARLQASRFTAARTADQTVSVYRALLDR